MTRLTRQGAADYWQERHRTSDPWRAGGDRGWDERTNEVLYYVRLGLLLRMLTNHFGRVSGLRILDAGCGRGWLTGQLRAIGYDAVGVDQSGEAIRLAKEAHSAPFFVAPLEGFACDGRFDAVVAMEVFFHIMDDDQWRQTLRNLARLLDDEGVLIFSAWMGSETVELGDYIVHRSRAQHERLLAELSLRIAVSEPYKLLNCPTSWHLCTRYGCDVSSQRAAAAGKPPSACQAAIGHLRRLVRRRR